MRQKNTNFRKNRISQWPEDFRPPALVERYEVSEAKLLNLMDQSVDSETFHCLSL